jgi:prepilin-type N-terminal cleavage/methylation domain-containing protein
VSAVVYRAKRTQARRLCYQGFTFIEILATLVILSIALPAVMQGISGCLTVASSAKCQSEAAELAHDKLMALAAEGQWQQGVLAGDFGPDIPLYQWKADVLEFESGTLRQLDVTVLWRDKGGKDKSITVSTLVYTAQAGQTGGVLE